MQKWKRYGTEAAVIVVGILLALFFDVAWAHRQDLAREAEYLEALRLEMEASLVELATDQQARQRVLSRTDDLLSAARDGADERSIADSAAVWVGALLDYRFFTPAQSVLEDLTASGNLQLIRSDDVRRAILGYVQERDRLSVVEQREMEFVSAQVEPLLRSAVALRDLLPLASMDDELPRMEGSIGPLRAALDDREFQNVVYLKWHRAEISQRFSSVVGRRLRRLIALLE